jgi:deoxyadenosine/deoxycytidine kinase
MIVIVDGLIAAGKTNLLKELNNHFENSKVIFEPVDHWEETGNLQRFYKALTIQDHENRSAQIYRFQTYVFQSRIKRILEQFSKDADIHFIERSIFSDRHIFMEMLYESGLVTDSDYDMYKNWWELWHLAMPIKPDAFIYLNPSVDECIRRYKKRARPGETIDEDYEKRLKKKHDSYFRKEVVIQGVPIPCLNLETDLDFRSGDGKEYIIQTIKNFLKNHKTESAHLSSGKADYNLLMLKAIF